MSTSNMAASWRQANDVIAPGCCDRQNPFEKFDDGQFIERFWLTIATTLGAFH